jgi:hypothetical protein
MELHRRDLFLKGFRRLSGDTSSADGAGESSRPSPEVPPQAQWASPKRCFPGRGPAPESGSGRLDGNKEE